MAAQSPSIAIAIVVAVAIAIVVVVAIVTAIVVAVAVAIAIVVVHSRPGGGYGMQPNIAFSYASTGGDGTMGRGWALSGTSQITRCPRSVVIDGSRGSVGYDANDAFCLDGSRLVLHVGEEGEEGSEYRTEQESFARVFLHVGINIEGPAWFEVHRPNGSVATYGRANGSGPKLSIEPITSSWRLNELRDRNANIMEFEYSQALYPPSGPRGAVGESWLTEIRYTRSEGGGSPAQADDRRVRFSYDERPDVSDGFRAGLSWRRSRRLTRVQTVLAGTIIHEYRVAYANSGPSGVSRVISIRECANAPATSGADVSGGAVCLPPTTFEWSLGDETSLYQTHLSLWSNTVDVGVGGRSSNFKLIREFTPV